MNNEGEPRRYVVQTCELLGRKDINANEKLVLAYISSFEQFYASNATTAEFLGLSERIVERAKQKLVRLGYITIVKKTGRGNIYAFNLLRLAKIGGADAPKLANQTSQNWRTENKEEIKDKTYIRDESVAEPVEKSAQYGRQDINDLIESWSDQVYDIRADKSQRRQAYNLIRKYGTEGAQSLVERVAAMKRQNDRFAPNIAKLSDLVGKYSKLDKLEAWEARQDEKPTLASAPSSWFQKPPEYPEISDEERAEVSQRFKEARKTLKFLQPKDGGAK